MIFEEILSLSGSVHIRLERLRLPPSSPRAFLLSIGRTVTSFHTLASQRLHVLNPLSPQSFVLFFSYYNCPYSILLHHALGQIQTPKLLHWARSAITGRPRSSASTLIDQS
jgi:hypothetical protein